MNKPPLPAIDAAGQLRETAFAMLVRDRRPAGLDDLARRTGLEPGAVRLSLATGPHSLTLGWMLFRTWWAYDALGIAAALGADALVETACGECGKSIEIEFHGGVPDRAGPERLWLADGGEDLRASFCTPTVLLCGSAHGAAWAETQAGRGQLLDLAEGARMGGSEWAGCAEASRRLA
jgi:hypothetical protein